jgi:hypothetical protein
MTPVRTVERLSLPKEVYLLPVVNPPGEKRKFLFVVPLQA